MIDLINYFCKTAKIYADMKWVYEFIFELIFVACEIRFSANLTKVADSI
jgi:hypothetical protein